MTESVRISAAALRYVLPHVRSGKFGTAQSGGVLLERSGVVVATNGHSLVAHRLGVEHVASDVIVRFHKPSEITRAKVATVVLDVTAGRVTNRSAMLLDDWGVVIGWTLYDFVEGPFPNWRAILPTLDDPRDGVLEEGRISLDPELVARFRVKGAGPIMMRPCGSTLAISVTYPKNSNAFGLAMPWRPEGLGTIPEWAYVANTPVDAIKVAA